jgi:hypothetical protein
VSAATPVLAALLRAALPGLGALDLGPSPALFPWLPGTLCGVEGAEALLPAEAALLRRFRHPDGRPLVGLDPAADAALLAGAPVAWGGAPERLIRLPTTRPPTGLPADVLLLGTADAEAPAGLPRARLLLLLGAGAAVERHDLLVPPARLGAIHAALGRAAETLAGGASLPGRWLARALAITDGMASVALLPEEAQAHRPPLSIPAAALVHDAPALAGRDGLVLPATGRVRLLLGAPPSGGLRVVLRGEGAPRAALFADGRRLPAVPVEHRPGEFRIEAEGWPPGGAGTAVLGVAAPAPARAVLTRLELLP